MFDIPSDFVEIHRVMIRRDNSNKCLTIWFNVDSGEVCFKGVEKSYLTASASAIRARADEVWMKVLVPCCRHSSQWFLKIHPQPALFDPACQAASVKQTIDVEVDRGGGTRWWWAEGPGFGGWLSYAPFSCSSDGFQEDLNRRRDHAFKDLVVSCGPNTQADLRK